MDTHLQYRRKKAGCLGRAPSHRRRSRAENRSGVATIECVLCLPVLFIITFATIDLCSAMFLKETLTIAAYEGARVGSASGGTDALAVSRIEEILDERGITYDATSVSFAGASFDDADTLELVTVTVQVPCASNLPVTSAQLFSGQFLSASVTLRKQFANP
ncbi:MAG: TadE/TadG family type IV pilus assembly protein [Planctomycetota bacterium]